MFSNRSGILLLDNYANVAGDVDLVVPAPQTRSRHEPEHPP